MNNTFKFQVGDLLLKIQQNDYWFDHVIIVGTELSLDEHVYQIYTSCGELERRTAEWIHLNYRRSDEGNSQNHTEVDSKTI